MRVIGSWFRGPLAGRSSISGGVAALVSGRRSARDTEPEVLLVAATFDSIAATAREHGIEGDPIPTMRARLTELEADNAQRIVDEPARSNLRIHRDHFDLGGARLSDTRRPALPAQRIRLGGAVPDH